MATPGADAGASRIDLAETADFDLGDLRVSPARRNVGLNGDTREVEPRVMQVLVALASARPEVVSRDRLIERCWDGRIVGDDALNRCVVALRHLARDFSPEPFSIETVPRVGYSLVERPANAASVPEKKWWQGRTRLALAALLAIALLAAAIVLAWPRSEAGADAPASIAVLPFRNLSGGDPYFAQGIGEEIIGQLAREPQFRVAGRTASGEPGADIREVARRLNVEYVLDGSVRTQGGRVRVNASLVRASDGIRMWSDSYDGTLDDIFAIQQRIGGAIAGALRRRLVRAPALTGPLVTNGEAYNLYLTARGLIRTRQRSVGATAANLLRDAINLDPGYAPAWASLAAALTMEGAAHGHEGLIAATPEAQASGRHALELAPDLAEAHRNYAVTLGYGSPEAQAHLRRAAALDPNNAESMIGLGVAHAAAGEFDQELAAFRRALELDPLWFRTTGTVGIALADRGDRTGAEAVARRALPNNEIQQHILLGRIAWISADFSEAARHWSIVARSNSPRWSDTARRSLNDAAYAVGLRHGTRVDVPNSFDQRYTPRVWMEEAPSAAAWQAQNRDRITADVYRAENLVAAKLMLNAGRARELAGAYDGAVGLLGMRAALPLRVDQLNEAPVVIIALREAGRTAEADRLLREADSAIRAVYGRGQVTFWFDAEAAAIRAVQGRTDEALSALERAIGRGWAHAGGTDLRDIANEPAFRSLRGQPRFERLRAGIAAHYARERAEIERLQL